MSNQPANITNFLAKFPGGFARPNRYMVEFQLPPGLSGNTGSWTNSQSVAGNIQSIGNQFNRAGAVQIACHTCALPPRATMVYLHTQYSAPFNVPYSQQYESATFSFYANSQLEQRKFFEIWQTTVMNINDNSINFMTEYASDVKIYQLDREGKQTYEVTLFSAWPQVIGEVNLSYDQKNMATSITVTMAYRLWKREDDTTSIFTETSRG